MSERKVGHYCPFMNPTAHSFNTISASGPLHKLSPLPEMLFLPTFHLANSYPTFRAQFRRHLLQTKLGLLVLSLYDIMHAAFIGLLAFAIH